MLENILTVGNHVLILFILIGIGFLCNKTKILTSISVKDVTNFVLYFVTPCVIINSFSRQFDMAMLSGLILTICSAFLSFGVNILIAHLFVKDKDVKRQKVLQFGSVFSNCGYMSLPLQSALLGDEGVFYGAAYIAVFQIVLWTYGILLMSGDKKNISFKKLIINPGVLPTVIGIIIFVTSFKIPFTIKEPIGYLASLNTPIPMIIVGYHLANANLKINGLSSWISIIIRLVISPLIMLGGLYLYGAKGVVLVACVIAASAPFAATTTMFSEKFGQDTSLSASLVSLTTLMSIITMPVIVGIAKIL